MTTESAVKLLTSTGKLTVAFCIFDFLLNKLFAFLCQHCSKSKYLFIEYKARKFRKCHFPRLCFLL